MIGALCIRNALQIAFREYTARRSCHEGVLFAAQTPRIMHDVRILPSLGVSFGCCGRGEGCRRSACGSRTPPRFVRGGAVLSRAQLLQLRAVPAHAHDGPGVAPALACDVPVARPPREARTFRGALCEVSAFASRRWVCLSPFTRRLCLVRSFRGGARC